MYAGSCFFATGSALIGAPTFLVAGGAYAASLTFWYRCSGVLLDWMTGAGSVMGVFSLTTTG